jgi:hypothetical protein
MVRVTGVTSVFSGESVSLNTGAEHLRQFGVGGSNQVRSFDSDECPRERN